MGGIFGVVSKGDCVEDLFYGTDYHSHLGTMRGGLAVLDNGRYRRVIHDITNSQFRSKFETDITKMHGTMGIGVISDFEDQPLIISSHHGQYSIVTVGVVQNLEELVEKAFENKTGHFSEMSGGEINPTEVVAMLINQEDTFTAGLKKAQDMVEGSCSILLLTEDGIYASRDRLGRTPIHIGKKENAYCLTFETCVYPNLDYRHEYVLGPAEIVLLNPDGFRQMQAPGEEMKICSFLWVYYGYPASNYEDINVEDVRYNCGKCLARRDDVEVDVVAGVPDSGTAHAIGYANEAGVPYARPFVKYTPTWPRSFMPQDQGQRDLVARMKLIPIEELIKGKKVLFCEDSIVRGTQLQDTVKRVFEAGASEMHMRPACPPLLFGCRFLNFSRSRSIMDLAGIRAVEELEGTSANVPDAYLDPDSKEYANMIEVIRERLGLTSLQYQRLDDLVEAIGLPKDKLCTYCWDAKG